jgi:hypothetical protein
VVTKFSDYHLQIKVTALLKMPLSVQAQGRRRRTTAMTTTTTTMRGILRPPSYLSSEGSRSSRRPRRRPRPRPRSRPRVPMIRFARRVRRRIIPHRTDRINRLPLALQVLPRRRRWIPPVDTASGSVWVDGLRRSARSHPVLGSIVVNGLRRSARRL